jgi:hypothetical protein
MQLRTEKPNITAKNYLTVGPGEYRYATWHP